MAEGQYTGSRATYLYQNDSLDKTYLITADRTLASLPGTGLVEATPATAATAVPLPKRYKLRCVYWQGVLGAGAEARIVKKRVVCGTPDALIYDADISQSLTIDGVVGSTTGRRGEQMTFPRITGTDAPPPAG